MKVKGLQKTTLLDYPGKVSCVLFLYGCNFKCGFCHNPELVVCENSSEISEEEVFDFLKKRRKVLEGVCITGGEPLLSLKKEFVKKIKELGYLVKVDTNGSFPLKLKEFINEGLVDYVAMDLKSSPGKYFEAAGCNVDMKKIKESIKLICESGVDYEFRTTVVPGIHDEEDVRKLGKWVKKIIGGKGKRYFLQGFKNMGKFIDLKYSGERDVSEEDLEKLKKVASDYFLDVGIRV